MTMKVKQVIDLLEENGYLYVRTRGDHRIFSNPEKNNTIVVAGKLSSDMPVGTLKSILRQLGL